jgi:hypothetical protein
MRIIFIFILVDRPEVQLNVEGTAAVVVQRCENLS